MMTDTTPKKPNLSGAMQAFEQAVETFLQDATLDNLKKVSDTGRLANGFLLNQAQLTGVQSVKSQIVDFIVLSDQALLHTTKVDIEGGELATTPHIANIQRRKDGMEILLTKGVEAHTAFLESHIAEMPQPKEPAAVRAWEDMLISLGRDERSAIAPANVNDGKDERKAELG